MSKTKKRPMTGSKRFDRTCRNHGSCPSCRSNRTHATRKQAMRADPEKKAE